MIRSILFAILATVALATTLHAQSDPGDKFWNVAFGPTFSVDGQIFAVEVSGQAIYIGGSFTHIAGIKANHIAKFENGVWDSLGRGVDGDVHAIKAFRLANQLLIYVGGSFHHADTTLSPGFALWTSNNWYSLGGGLDPLPMGVYAIAVDPNGNPYAAGSFVNIRSNGDTLRNIAHWDGNNWKPLAGGVTNWRGALPVFALQFVQDTLFVGGFFDFVDGHLPAKGVARWAKGAWSPVGPIDSNNVHITSLAIYRGELYAAGEFSSIGNDTAKGIAHWNGSKWLPMTDDPGFWIGALAVNGNTLFASHFDIGPTGVKFNNVAAWYGVSGKWSPMGDGIHGGVTSLAPMPFGGVIAAGYFDSAGRMPAQGLASWEVPAAVHSTALITMSGLTIYPQPLQHQGTVEFTLEHAGDVELIITDLLGRTVGTRSLTHLTTGQQKIPLTLSAIKSGTYFLRISGIGLSKMMTPFIVE